MLPWSRTVALAASNSNMTISLPGILGTMLAQRSQSHPFSSKTSNDNDKGASWTKVATKSEVLSAPGGRKVVVVAGQKVLLAALDGEVYAVSNKCTHLGLPLVGKTAMLQGQIKEGCIVCPAHGTHFDLKTGAVKGDWCPSMPKLPLIGKGTEERPLPTYQVRVDEAGNVEVLA